MCEQDMMDIMDREWELELLNEKERLRQIESESNKPIE